jgi:hypothetical protein
LCVDHPGVAGGGILADNPLGCRIGHESKVHTAIMPRVSCRCTEPSTRQSRGRRAPSAAGTGGPHCRDSPATMHAPPCRRETAAVAPRSGQKLICWLQVWHRPGMKGLLWACRIGLVLLVGAVGCHPRLRSADSAMRRGDYALACPIYEQEAKRGNIESQNNIGSCHYYGLGGFPVDHEAGRQWWIRAARSGNVVARNRLSRHGIMWHRLLESPPSRTLRK